MTLDDFVIFCRKIDISQELTFECYNFLDTLKADEIDLIYSEINHNDVDYSKIIKKLEDKNGIKLLSVYLYKSFYCYKKYKQLHISEEIYIDTFKCFSRFIRETKVYNDVIFDRYFWTWRQTELRLFRIGELEYEIVDDDNEISIHIPSDACLDDKKIDNSISKAKEFFKEKFERTINYKFSICSWIVNESLEKLLPKNSKILKFKERFEICKVFPNDNSFITFIFKTKSNDINSFNTKTILQKNLVLYLKEGYKFGSSYGVLKERK